MSWVFGLTTEIPLDLRVETIIGKSDIDSPRFEPEQLSTSMVIGETFLYLPERGVFTAKIEGVIGSMTIYVPDSMEISINSDVGLLNVQLPEDFISEQANSYFSPGYAGC